MADCGRGAEFGSRLRLPRGEACDAGKTTRHDAAGAILSSESAVRVAEGRRSRR